MLYSLTLPSGAKTDFVPAEPDDAGELASAPLPVSHGVVGVLMFIGTEIMFFAGLITAFLILRAGAMAWPPPGQPRLPVAVTGLNTLILLASGATMYLALRAIRSDTGDALIRWMILTAVLGAVFLAVQGFEWIRLVGYGLTAASSLYGATFYVIVGAHGLHVLGALAALLAVIRYSIDGCYSASSHGGVEACWLYWTFVAALWPVLYALIYLS